jgi:hypothetical protein
MPRLKKPPGLRGTCDAARFPRVHRSTLDSWRRGILKPTAVEDGPRYRYSLTDLDAFKGNVDYM